MRRHRIDQHKDRKAQSLVASRAGVFRGARFSFIVSIRQEKANERTAIPYVKDLLLQHTVSHKDEKPQTAGLDATH